MFDAVDIARECFDTVVYQIGEGADFERLVVELVEANVALKPLVKLDKVAVQILKFGLFRTR